LKRELSSSETVGGGQQSDPDLVEMGSVDLRAERRAKRVRKTPGLRSEVIELDD
jgi:hypothetical protein